MVAISCSLGHACALITTLLVTGYIVALSIAYHDAQVMLPGTCTRQINETHVEWEDISMTLHLNISITGSSATFPVNCWLNGVKHSTAVTTTDPNRVLGIIGLVYVGGSCVYLVIMCILTRRLTRARRIKWGTNAFNTCIIAAFMILLACIFLLVVYAVYWGVASNNLICDKYRVVDGVLEAHLRDADVYHAISEISSLAHTFATDCWLVLDSITFNSPLSGFIGALYALCYAILLVFVLIRINTYRQALLSMEAADETNIPFTQLEGLVNSSEAKG